jgi:hypothetical protein
MILRPPFPSFPTTVFRSTLSGLLFQINLKHLLSISFLFFSSNRLFYWKVIPCKYIAKLGKKWLVFSQNLDNITVNKYAKQIPEFYGEVLRSWNKIGGGPTRTPLHFVAN